jgi:hypothetical protein
MLLSFYLALILIFHLEWPHLYSIAYEVFGSGAKLIGNSLKAP